jgi:hypothetical protein
MNKGFYEETRMINALNNKKYKSLNNNLKCFLDETFGYGFIKKNDVMYASKVNGFYKSDISITVRNETKNVSIKSRKAEVIHEERIKSFILFLRSLGVSTETQKTILLHQYGDGTLDGTGTKRMCYEELHYVMSDRIKKANEELNSNKELVRIFVEHCLFIGVIENPVIADCVYHGTIEFGVCATREKIIKHVMRKNYNFYNNLHIGPILFRPHARYVDKVATDESRRHRVECYWPHLAEDIDYISTRY